MARSPSSSPSSLLQTLLNREEEAAKRITAGTARRWDQPEGEGYCGRRERDRQAGWLVAACNRLRLHADSVSLSIAIFDRIISEKQVACRYGNCVAAASLYIAKKICEEGDESPYTFLDSLGLAYSAGELKRMELIVLNTLEWDALLPSVERFATAQLQSVGFGWAAPYLRAPLEAALSKGSVAGGCRASLLSLAIVSLLLQRITPHWLSLTHTLMGDIKAELGSLILARESVARLLPATQQAGPASPSFYGGKSAFFPGGHFNPYSPLTPDDSSEDAGGSGDERAREDDVMAVLASPRPLQPTQC